MKSFGWQGAPTARWYRCRTASAQEPGALKTMQAAAGYGFRDGFVVPFHIVDPIGRVYSRLCSLIWKDHRRDFRNVVSVALHQMHVVLIY